MSGMGDLPRAVGAVGQPTDRGSAGALVGSPSWAPAEKQRTQGPDSPNVEPPTHLTLES